MTSITKKQGEEIIARLEKIEQHTQKMAEHIEFINGAYDKYKTGFDAVYNMFSPKRDSSTTRPE